MVVTEMLTIVKSIITIAMAGTSGHSTLHRWYSGVTGAEANGPAREMARAGHGVCHVNLGGHPPVSVSRGSPSGGGSDGSRSSRAESRDRHGDRNHGARGGRRAGRG